MVCFCWARGPAGLEWTTQLEQRNDRGQKVSGVFGSKFPGLEYSASLFCAVRQNVPGQLPVGHAGDLYQ